MTKSSSTRGRIPDHLPRDLIARIEAWRLAQPVPPSKTRAIAYLIERGLAGLAVLELPPRD